MFLNLPNHTLSTTHLLDFSLRIWSPLRRADKKPPFKGDLLTSLVWSLLFPRDPQNKREEEDTGEEWRPRNPLKTFRGLSENLCTR